MAARGAVPVLLRQARQRLLVEHRADQPEALVQREPLSVTDRDAGRLLPSMLEGVKPDVGQAGDVGVGRPDADDPALLARAVRVVGGDGVDGRGVQPDRDAHDGRDQVGRCGPGTSPS